MANVNLRMLVLEMLMDVTDGRRVNEHAGENWPAHTYSHTAVRNVLNKYNHLSIQEKSFIKRLFEGTLERMIELDYVINLYSKVKTDKMKPVIRAILRLGAYQILYMDAVPDSAACNESVKLAQQKGFSTLKGFVNGILRNIAKNKADIEYPNLSVKYSMPEWILELWRNSLGGEKMKDVLCGLLLEHPVTVRFRNLSVRGEVEEALSAHGGRMEKHPYLDYAYKVYKTDDMTRLPHYDDGGFVVQDASSMLAVKAVLAGDFLADFKEHGKEMRIADVCAAPGGKSMLLADLLNERGIRFTIEAGDISEKKVKLMAENFARCGFDEKKISAVVRDAAQYDGRQNETADIVIADVPCSGLGVIGKKRDIKYKMTSAKIDDIVKLQKQILRTSVSILKPGGRMLFCTCTINNAENEENFAWLVEELKMIPVPFDDALPKCIVSESKMAKNGYLQLLPKIHDTDGFFISVLKKQNGA